MDIDLPDYVVEDPIIKSLNQAANDLVTFVYLFFFQLSVASTR